MKMDRESILWNLRNGASLPTEHIDEEDFEVAGIDINELSDEQLWLVLQSMKKHLMETLSERIGDSIRNLP